MPVQLAFILCVEHCIIRALVRPLQSNEREGICTMKILQAILLLAVCMPPGALATMRCGTQLVLEGYDFDRVEQLCGAADSTYTLGERYIYRTVKNHHQEASIAEVVHVDLWVYRGSRNTMPRKLYFEDGILVRIEVGDHS